VSEQGVKPSDLVVRWILALPMACFTASISIVLSFFFVYLLSPATIQMYGPELMPLFALFGGVFFVMTGANMVPIRSKFMNWTLVIFCLGISIRLFDGQIVNWLTISAVGLGGVLGILLIPFPAFCIRQLRIVLEGRRLAILRNERANGIGFWGLFRLYMKVSFRRYLISEYEVGASIVD
jgi:hypothetical protein